MHKYRVQFEKGESVRYISHLDLSKLFQRAFRRAHLPVAYSEGFNPHPKMSLASALRLGFVSRSEYLDVELSEEMDPALVHSVLQKSLPAGIQIRIVRVIPDDAPAAMAVINAAEYSLMCSDLLVAPETAEAALQALLDEDELMVDRETKKGMKRVDLKPLIYGAVVCSDEKKNASIHLLLAASDQGTARPEEVAALLCQKGFCPGEGNIHIERIGLYRRYPDGELKTPLEVLSKDSMVKPE